MKAKLIKTNKGNYILIDPTKHVYKKGYLIGSLIECDVPKLSKQNCDEIFGVVDVEKLAEEYCTHEPKNSKELRDVNLIKLGFRDGFNKAMELNKDKVFTEFDIISAFEYGWNQRHFDKTDEDELLEIKKRFIQSIKQPTEIAVEIKLEPCFYDDSGVDFQHLILRISQKNNQNLIQMDV